MDKIYRSTVPKTGTDTTEPNSFASKAQSDFVKSEIIGTSATTAFDTYYAEVHTRYNVATPTSMYESSKFWPHFVQIAMICTSHGWNVEDYIQNVLDSAGKRRRLLPKDLCMSSVINSYALRKSAATESSAQVTTEYAHCIELLIQGEIEGGDEKVLLLSPNTSFPAWFRVCYPEQLDIDIINAWGAIAKRELSNNRDLMLLMKQIAPEKWARIQKALWFFATPEEV